MLAFWGAFAVIVMDAKPKLRSPSSVLPAPKLMTTTNSIPQVGPFSVIISAANGIPDHDEQELTLTAEVVLNTAVDSNVEWSWNLPASATIVSGEKTDVWPGMKSGERAHTEISVLNVSKDAMKTVTFTVRASAKNSPIDGVASFATQANPDNLNSSLERSASHR
jgi:hypothetical protein